MTPKELLSYLNRRFNEGLDFVEVLGKKLPDYMTLREHIYATAVTQSFVCDILFELIYS